MFLSANELRNLYRFHVFGGIAVYVFVLDKHKKPLTPCRPSRARYLLDSGRAVVHKHFPFTIRLKDRLVGECVVKPVRVKVDPGAKFTGIAVVREDKRGEPRLVAGIELEHRGGTIRDNMTKRANYRRRRRNANTRYRAPRFDNRRKPEGWLPPSLQHRVNTTMSWMRRLMRIAPVSGFAVESVKFDMQKMQNPEVSGTEYQQGELAGYEVREYLLEKWGRKCAYCGAENVPLQVEHIIPRARGGSDRVSNLTLACEKCNQAKGARPVEEFLCGHTAPSVRWSMDKRTLLARIKAQAKAPLSSASAVNSTRNALLRDMRATGLPVETGSGGLTKYNRTRIGLSKSHVLDALCVGFVNSAVVSVQDMLKVGCAGRGKYARTHADRYGFPRAHLPRVSGFFGFSTGDIVRADVRKGKYEGVWTGRISVRSSGWFSLATGKRMSDGKRERVNVRHDVCTLIQRNDGYEYVHAEIG